MTSLTYPWTLLSSTQFTSLLSNKFSSHYMLRCFQFSQWELVKQAKILCLEIHFDRLYLYKNRFWSFEINILLSIVSKIYSRCIKILLRDFFYKFVLRLLFYFENFLHFIVSITINVYWHYFLINAFQYILYE